MSTVISIQAGSEPIKQAVMHESQEYWFGHEKLLHCVSFYPGARPAEAFRPSSSRACFRAWTLSGEPTKVWSGKW